MKINIELIYKNEEEYGVFTFSGNKHSNCFHLNNFPPDFNLSPHTVIFVCVPCYPLNLSLLKFFENVMPQYPLINFYFSALENEFRVNEFLQGKNKEYHKVPVLLFYKNGIKIFEQVAAFFQAAQLTNLLQQYFPPEVNIFALSQKFSNNINSQIADLHELSTHRPLLIREQIELRFLQKIQAADSLESLQSIENEVISLATDETLKTQLAKCVEEKKRFY